MNKIISSETRFSIFSIACPQAKACAGFTLMELIISMTILSVVALIIGSGFRLGIQTWDKGDKEIQETQRLRALSGMISQNLKSAYPYKTEVEDKKVIIFKGDKNSVLFVTTSAASYAGGFRWVKYSYSDGVLKMDEGILPDKKLLDNISENEEVLDSGIREVSFGFLSSEDNEWKDSWDFTEELPAAVKVSIEYFPPFFVTLPMSIKKEETDTGRGKS